MKRLLTMAPMMLWGASANAQPPVDPASVTWEGLIGLALFGVIILLLGGVVASLAALFKWAKARIKTRVGSWKD
ncbi:MAG: hypothetical protein AB7U30_07410 [Sulfuricellaceae bacterium]|jgi:hypothetical protein